MRDRSGGKVASIEPRLSSKPRLRFEMFGAPRFSLGSPLKLEAPPRTLPLVAYVVLHGPAPVPRAAVAAAMWPDASEEDARTNFRRHVHSLRKALGAHGIAEDVLLSEGASVRLNPALDLSIDLNEYVRLAQSDHTLPEAVALYRGELLESLGDEWVHPERLRLHAAQLAHLERLADLARADGDRHGALRRLCDALDLEPWNEELAVQAMSLAWECGRRNEALLLYRRFAARLQSELGAQPLPRTIAIHTSVVEGRPFRPAGFIPEDTTSFVGRSTEFRSLVERARHERLITLTGPPGIGKTRLAMRAARYLMRSFADGAFAVDLTSSTDAASIRSSLGAALDLYGAEGSRNVPLEQRLRAMEVLVLLDNCEHIGDACAAVLGPLLAAAPGLRVLATSHDRLNISAERVFGLGPMDATTEGPALFLARARAIDANFTVHAAHAVRVREMCAMLDGLPLAIELAAVRAPTTDIIELEQSLHDRFAVLDRGYRDAPPHHRTLESAFARSVGALSEMERRVFLASSVFAGGWDSTELVALLEWPEAGGIARACERLVERSLVAVESVMPRRYRLLHSARAYAWRTLDEAERASYRMRHASIFAALAEQACRNAVPTTVWFGDVAREIGNYRATLDFALVERHDVTLGAALAGSLGSFWQFGAYRLEGLRYVERALAEAPSLDDATTGRLWLARAGFFVADEERIRCAEHARDAFARAGDRHGFALALQRIATHDVFNGRFERAETNLDESIRIFTEVGDDFRVDRCEKTRADLERLRGNTAVARDRYEACLVKARAREDSAGVEAIVMGLAETEQRLGNTKRALALTYDALDAARDRGDAVNLAGFGLNVAAYLLRLGREEEALAAAFEALTVAEDAELAGLFVPIALQHVAASIAKSGAIPVANSGAIAVAKSGAIAVARSGDIAVAGSGDIPVAGSGDVAVAAMLTGFADEGYRASASMREDTEQRERDDLAVALGERLDAQALAGGLAAGAALTRSDAIALARTLWPRRIATPLRA